METMIDFVCCLLTTDLPIQAVGFPSIEGSTVREKISAIGGHRDVRLHHQGASLGIAIVVLLPHLVLLLHPRGLDIGHVVHCEGRQDSSAWVFTVLIDIDCKANLFLAVSGLLVSFFCVMIVTILRSHSIFKLNIIYLGHI